MTLMQKILNLSHAEKIDLLDKVWDSMDKSKITLTENQQKDLDQRLKLDEEGKVEYKAWAEVKKEIAKHR